MDVVRTSMISEDIIEADAQDRIAGEQNVYALKDTYCILEKSIKIFYYFYFALAFELCSPESQ